MNVYSVQYSLKRNSARQYSILIIAESEFEARKQVKKEMKRESFRIHKITKVSK